VLREERDPSLATSAKLTPANVQGVRGRADADRREIVGLITGAIEADRSREAVAP